MSYSIWIQDLPACIQSLDDIPDDFLPGVIGARSDIIQKILREIEFRSPVIGGAASAASAYWLF